LPRVPLVDTNSPDVKPLADRIAAERGSVLDLYKMLLHSPAVAEGWLHYLTAIRQKCSLAGQLRELVVMRIATLNRAAYEAEQHLPYALREGLTREQLSELARWEVSSLFSSLQRVVLAYTDCMTREIQVSDEVFVAVRQHFNDRELVELTATISAYNMVSRFLEALAIHAQH
jgi:AhpD family alkylhydroperoxidase